MTFIKFTATAFGSYAFSVHFDIVVPTVKC